MGSQSALIPAFKCSDAWSPKSAAQHPLAGAPLAGEAEAGGAGEPVEPPETPAWGFLSFSTLIGGEK